MSTKTDKTLLILTALFVGGLAVVAGAISFDHMRELATHHDQSGWKSLAFPISVDGLEIVASLYLVAQRRAERPTGWVPWVALFVGTAASLSANVAVGGADPIGKALAGWPALSMLVSVKLLFAMFDHETKDDQRTIRAEGGTYPYHYVLGQLGVEVVAAHRGEDLPRKDQARRRRWQLTSRANLPHLLGVNQFFTDLAGHARTYP